MPATIMERELTDRWTKTRPSIAQLSALASCGHVLFLADFITSTFGSSFQYTQPLRRVLESNARYYNEVRTHRSLGKDAPPTPTPRHLGRAKFSHSHAPTASSG